MKKILYTLVVMLLVAGVIDVALAGPVDPVKKCKTCGKPLSLCQGHNTANPKKERKEPPKKQTESKKESKPRKKQVTPAGYDVTITSNAGSDATLYIDGTNYGKSSGSHYLKAGSHSVILTADGYDDFYRTINVDKNNTWFSFVMTEKSADALCQLGENYLNGKSGYPKDYNKAVHWFRKAADKGFAKAQNWLGRCYQEGWGVSKNDSEAVKCFRKAADQGDASGQYNLGYCYEHGNGVEQSYSKAVEWYRKSADQGLAWAQYNLGYCYEHGKGVMSDRNKAIQWYRKAADQGHDDAKSALKRLESSGSVTRIVRTDLKKNN